VSADTPDRFARLSEIVGDAPTGIDAAGLSTWLDTACDGDPWLREQAAELLEHEDAVPTAFLVPPGGGSRRGSGDRPLPERIGPFTVTGHLGRGGMGEVFAARDEEAGRDVAIKVVRAGTAGNEVLARFEAERRMLARMEHPGIARVWSVGRTDDGEPWLAMELVPGARDIVRDADERGLGLRDRVALMAAGGDAVHHAHQKGVVHRDLKPGNIVVAADAPGPPQPRVIDFGVARLVGEAALLDFRTRAGQLIGTQAYMAPEQARDPAAADVRSDVFGLGTVLYELVTGRRAFASAGGPPAAPPHAAGGPFPIPPDLDLIVRTAIAEDPELRYGSAEALAADLRRFLDDVPIAARPPTTAYVVRKFVRRHRAAVLASTVAVALLAATSILATAQAVRATRAEAATMRFAYRAGIVAAASALRERDGLTAAAFLDDLPAKARGWEWGHLDRLARSYRIRVDGFGVWVETIAHDADGRMIVQPTVGTIDRRTVAPRWREDMLVLAGEGLSVHGRRAVSWAQRDIRVVDTVSGSTLHLFEPDFKVSGAAIRGDVVVALDEDGVLRRTSLADPAWIRMADTGAADAVELRPRADGSVLVVRHRGVMSIAMDGSTREFLFPGQSAPRLSPDASLVAAGDRRGRVTVHDVADGTIVAEITDLPDPGDVIAFLGDDRHLAVGDARGAIHLVDRIDGTVLGPPRLGHAGAVTALAVGPDGRLWSADFGRSVMSWDVDPVVGDPHVIPHASAVSHVAFAADGQLITSSLKDGIRRWGHGLAEPAIAEPGSVGAWRACPLPGGGRAWSTVKGTLTIRGDDRLPDIRIFDDPHVESLALSPDGRRIAVFHSLSGLAIVDVATGAVTRPPNADAGTSTGVRIGAWLDDEVLLLSEADSDLVTLDTGTGERRLLQPDLKAASIARVDAGRAFLGTYDGELVELQLPGGTITRRHTVHGRSVTALAISPDRRRLATGDDAGAVSVRDVADGQELLRLDAGNGVSGVLDLAWSPGGSALAAGFTGGVAKIWISGPRPSLASAAMDAAP
jgi:WD40 repeat protein